MKFTVLIFAICLTTSASNEVPDVETSLGIVKGIKEMAISAKDFSSYMRIPYAKPPIGDLRFKDPVPVEPWKGTLDGTRMPEPCLQAPMFDIAKDDDSEPIIFGQEDCLYLNVFTTKINESKEKFPVMVFIHGGAFVYGSSLEYPPHTLLSKDIVLVTLQYRLGVLGFLSTGDSVLPGNMGLKDQQLALKWIKGNILNFGGDPEKITIFGESAGAASVHMQMLSPGSKGLFQRAIAQSGSALDPWATRQDHKSYAVSIGNSFKCSLDGGTESYLKCMQTIAAKFLIQHAEETSEWGMSPVYVLPRVDGDFLPESPDVLIRDGKYAKVDYLSGMTRDEGSLITSMMMEDPEMIEDLNSDFEKYGPMSIFLSTTEDEKKARKIYQHYLGQKQIKITPENVLNNLTKLYTDIYFRVGHYLTSLYNVHDEDLSVYLYQLNHEGQRSFSNIISTQDIDYGVSHADDLFYLFSGGQIFFQPLERKEDLIMREIFLNAWVNFAKYGNPTPPGSDFLWEKATGKNFKQLNLIPNPYMENLNIGGELEFLESVGLKIFKNLYGNDSLTNLKAKKNKQEL